MSLIFNDYESKSRIDLKRSTHSVYANDPSTEIHFVAVAHDDGPVRIERRLGPVPRGTVAVHWGAFDEAIWRAKEHMGPCDGAFLDLMQVGLYLGLPHSLDGAAVALGLDSRKDPRGEYLINKFCKPRKDGTFLAPEAEPENWKAFQEYAIQDVKLLREVYGELRPYVGEWARYQRANERMVARMNARGVPIDRAAVAAAIERVELAKPALIAECEAITGGIGPMQVGALTAWLGVPNLRKQNVLEWVADESLPADKRRVLELRLKANYPSVAKLPRMLELSIPDGRARDQFLNNGAHTGRLTSWGIQFHNMKAAKPTPGFFEALDAGAAIDDPIEAVAQNMRGFIRAPAGRKLLVSDYAQIECRALAWLAGEEKLLRAFRAGHDVYRMMAANIFERRISEILKGSDERQKGKVVVLGCGYQLGAIGLVKNARLQWGMQIEKSLAERAVASFRNTFTCVVELWGALDLAMRTLANKAALEMEVADKLLFKWSDDMKWVSVELPSGRRLRYREPRTELVRIKRERTLPDGTVEKYEFDAEQICFLSRSGGSLIPDWTYGGKLTENIVQAIAFDVMAHGMANAELLGFAPIMSVHDEVVAEISDAEATAETIAQYNALLCDLPRWAVGIPVVAEGWIDERYHK